MALSHFCDGIFLGWLLGFLRFFVAVIIEALGEAENTAINRNVAVNCIPENRLGIILAILNLQTLRRGKKEL